MKCKICGHEISETDTICPGCDTSVEELKQNNNIMSNVEENVVEKANETVANTSVETAETPVETAETPVETAETPSTETVGDTTEEVPVENPNSGMSSEEAAIYDSADVVIGAPLDSNVAVDAAAAEEAKPATNGEVKEEKTEKKKGGAGKVVLVIVILLILAIAGACGYYFLVYTKPSLVISKVMNNTLVVTPSNDRYVNIKANVEVSKDGISKYTVDSKVDLTNLVSDTNIVFGDANKNVTILNDGENSYIKFDEIYTNSIKFEDSLLYEKLNYSNYVPFMTHMNNVKGIISEIKNVLPNVIDESKFAREFTTVTVDQKNMGAIRFGYKLDQTDTNKLFLNLANEIKKNKSIMSNLMAIYTLPEVEVAELVDGYFKNLSVNGFEINLYTDYLTNKYYMAEVVVKGINSAKLTVKFDENNKVNSIGLVIGSDQIDITNNYRHIEILRTTNGRVAKFVIDITYTAVPSVEVVVPEEYTEYAVLGKETLEASMATDKALTDAYNLIVKDANVVYVAPEVPEAEPTNDVTPSTDVQTTEPTTDATTNNNQE